jgi:hypothetical protein
VGPRAGLDAAEKIKFLTWRESNPGLPARRYPEYFKGGTETLSCFEGFGSVYAPLSCREGKALGNEEGKGLGSGICYEQRKEFEQGFTAHGRIDTNVGRAASE